jgi:Na+(H+)/acetate symporter ActP
MQFIILYIGILVFVFYQFVQPPVFHNQTLLNQARESSSEIGKQEIVYSEIHKQKAEVTMKLAVAIKENNDAGKQSIKQELEILNGQEKALRAQVKESISAAIPGASTLDKDYVFITFVMNYLPHGLIGLLMAVVFMAAMSSTASELNALASTTMVDIYKRSINPTATDVHYVKYSRAFTMMWAVFAMGFANIANLFILWYNSRNFLERFLYQVPEVNGCVLCRHRGRVGDFVSVFLPARCRGFSAL